MVERKNKFRIINSYQRMNDSQRKTFSNSEIRMEFFPFAHPALVKILFPQMRNLLFIARSNPFVQQLQVCVETIFTFVFVGTGVFSRSFGVQMKSLEIFSEN